MSDARRPALAIICNSLPPYRVHLHRRIVREMPEVHLLTVCTHEDSGGRWKHEPPAEINPVSFGPGESTSNQAKPRFAFHEWRKGGRIIQWIKERGVRAVVLSGYNDLCRVRILLWCRMNRIPCFISGDANILIDNPPQLKRIVKKAVLTVLLKAATGLFPCGQNGEAFFRRYGVPKWKIYWVPYEPNIEEIQELSSEFINATASKYGLDMARRRLVFSGRLIPLKRVDQLIDAFVAIEEQRKDWDLLIIGDGPLRGVLEERVPERLRSRVQWTGFLGDQTEISALYRCSDVLVLPSNREQWALVVPEAAAAGVALMVASSVGSAVEFVQEGINGRTFLPDDLQSLVAGLRDVSSSPQIDEMKKASIEILTCWRREHDPIKGLRKALADSTVIMP